MKTRWTSHVALTVGALVLPFLVAGTAIGADVGAAGYRPRAEKMWLACENGRNYPIRPLAVSREYDLVTGYLLSTGSGHSIHVRLVPMGVGYRYAGRGVWFDGLRGEAVLNWGTRRAVPCTVEREGPTQ